MVSPTAAINVDFSSVSGVNLTGQDVDGKQIVALIGREVLSMGIFIYNGHRGGFSFAYNPIIPSSSVAQ